MFVNYLKIALRNLSRNKVYSLINILGLSLGVACCLLLALYIQDEMSFDKHHTRLNDIYRIVTVFHNDDGIHRMRSTSPPIGLTMGDEIPEVEAAVRVLNPPGVARNLITYEDKTFYETDGLIADSSLFEVLTYELLEGNQKKALTDANTVVISDKLAMKLFGKESALDKSITISQGGPQGNFKVTGVFKELGKSHLQANFFVSMTSAGWGEYINKDPEAANEWAGQNFVPAYLKLLPGHSKDEVVSKMNQVLEKHGAEDMKALGMKKTLDLELVKDIYLKSDVGQSPRIAYTYVIASIATFILLIACINFMNLSTAKATKRAGEIGIRKVMGAERSSLIRQILGEAMVVVAISILISVIIVQLTLPFFNELTGKQISFGTENLVYFVSALLTIAIATGVIAGSYPAFYISSFEPAQVLKGKLMIGSASGWLRQSLVVFQFMVAITLVCGMIVISRQLNFMQEKDLGFDSHAKIVLPLRTASAQKSYETLKKELQSIGSVKMVSATEYIPGSYIWSDMLFYPQGGSMDNTVQNQRARVDYGYIEQLGIKMIAGRSFSDNRAMEAESNVIINRTSAKEFGIEPEKIVGQPLYFDWQGKQYSFKVIGVMEDYHQVSPKSKIDPTMFRISDKADNYDFMIVSTETTGFDNTVKLIEAAWKKQVIDAPFEYSFLDQNIQKQYDEDKKLSTIITSFTMVALLISCLGLYGLSSFMAERRFKEIGVRKVLGASVQQIVGLMSMEFVKLVMIAFVIAAPLAWYVMDKWLSGFAYRAAIDFTIFAIAGVGALMIALLTVSYESTKAASVNPTESLRSE